MHTHTLCVVYANFSQPTCLRFDFPCIGYEIFMQILITHNWWQNRRWRVCVYTNNEPSNNNNNRHAIRLSRANEPPNLNIRIVENNNGIYFTQVKLLIGYFGNTRIPKISFNKKIQFSVISTVKRSYRKSHDSVNSRSKYGTYDLSSQAIHLVLKKNKNRMFGSCYCLLGTKIKFISIRSSYCRFHFLRSVFCWYI